jgi:hypothetical protein
MTETEMRIVREVLWECGGVLVCFDQRTADKKILFVTADEPTMLRYIIDSPVFSKEQKVRAQSTLDWLMEEKAEGLLRLAPFQVAQHLFEADGNVLHCAPTESA